MHAIPASAVAAQAGATFSTARDGWESAPAPPFSTSSSAVLKQTKSPGLPSRAFVFSTTSSKLKLLGRVGSGLAIVGRV